jgi:4-amino-4-deoxy-L-arabinose transferase-like glycosyltransferase
MRRLYNAYQVLWLNHPIRQRVCMAALIFLLALSARVHLAYTGRIEYDEKDYAKAAVQYANHLKSGDLGFIIQDDYNYEHPVFNKLIYSLALLPFKAQSPFDLSMHWSVQKISQFHEVVAMRLVSVGFGSLTAFLLALVNPWAGLFLAVHTYAIKYTSVIYLEALPLFAALVSFQAFSIFLKHGPGKQTFKWLVLSSAALGIAAASKYMYAVIGVVEVLFCGLWMIRKRQAVFGYLAIWACLSLLVFWAADPFLWANPIQHLSASLKFHVDFSHGPAVEYTAYPFWQPIQWLLKSMPQQPLTRTPFFLQGGDFWISIDSWIFGLSLIGLPLMIKRHPDYFIWLVVGLAFLLVWSTKWPQYVLLVLPALCLAAAEGVQTFFLAGKISLQKLIPARQGS